MFDSTFFSYHTCKDLHSTVARLLYHLLLLLMAVAPINVLAGGATDDSLLHVCMYCSTATTV